jgi:KipI family sensor histidine kinase inhibitor
VKIRIAGDSALRIEFATAPGPDTSARIAAARARLAAGLGDLARDLVPGFATLLVIHEPLRITPAALRRRIAALLADLDDAPLPPGKTLELPVYYSPEAGPDLAAIARHSGLGEDGVIACHSEREYRVLAIGFAPGFAYLGDLDPRLAVPRRATPRTRVPKGAVAIANRQTAVYPQASPGGWHLIGLCPTPLFDPGADPPMPFAVGDRVRFRPVGRADYLALGGEL